MRFPSRLWLVALVLGSGVAHFVIPEFYERIVPRPLGPPRVYVHASGAAEIVAGLLLAAPRTRRLGGWLTAVLLVAVFPANVQMALDAGRPGADGLLRSPAVAWLRLPFQVPLVWWALREGRGGDHEKRVNSSASSSARLPGTV